MAKKKRRNDATLVDAAPAPRHTVPGRGTLAVARANRVLSETLPGLMYVGRREVRQKAKVRAEAVERPALSSLPDRNKPRERPSVADRQLSLDKRLPEACKERPKTSKGGSGLGRPFVPWCDRKK